MKQLLERQDSQDGTPTLGVCVLIEGKTKSESLARRSSRDEDGYKEEGKNPQWDSCWGAKQLDEEFLSPEQNWGFERRKRGRFLLKNQQDILHQRKSE